jgi:hypothetical protein
MAGKKGSGSYRGTKVSSTSMTNPAAKKTKSGGGKKK